MAMILDAFVGRYINKLSEFLEGEMSMMLGVEDELRRLQRRMTRISGFLESAERKRLREEGIRIWVSELKDVMYDADDIIDLCVIEGRKLLEGHPSTSVVRHPLSLFSCFSCIKFRYEIGSKIRKLNNRLKEIAEDESILSKLEHTTQDVHESRINQRQTFPNEIKSDIVGTQIEEATQNIVESLIKEDNNKKYRVLVIDGMGGIGKTTLASNIYNDKRIKENFPIRAWVCVSKDFSEIKLLKEMIRSIGGNYGEAETKAELIPKLSSILVKRFFIILDDIWSSDVWENLVRYPLESATASGRIIITTRNRNVAIDIRAEVRHVGKMDNNTGWALLCKKVFGDDDVEEEINNLREIGIKIVKKCDGLPLAIKTIAGVLRSKERSSLEWDKVLKSDSWSMSQLQEELPGALFLSYEDLPSDLKQCFLYCSLFPEDSTMDQRDLIRYWVAEGFVKGTQLGDTLMEDLAKEYYTELIRRNLLQVADDNEAIRCTMHDVLRSFAIFLIGDESTFCSNEQSPNINPLVKLRRLSMVNMKERLSNVIKQQNCLRTLMLRWSPGIKIIIENEPTEKLRFLRIITINDTGLESVPDSLGNLSHLRYLDLDRTKIKELPESIGCLLNLQTLNLSGCQFLHKLPKTITKLCNLRCLRLEGTALTHVPKGIGKLKHLNHLEGFVVGHDDTGASDEEGCDIYELRSLSQLRFLLMDRLEMAQAGGAPVLTNCHFLRTLILYCKIKVIQDIQHGEIYRIDETYEGLSPPSTLQILEIYNFFGTAFPRWMMSPSLHASFPNLTTIVLSGCTSCPQLPPLGLLRQLKFLDIYYANAITTIGPEFLGPSASSAPTAFPKLEVLRFADMENWEEWSFMEMVSEERREAPKLLPCLRSLALSTCPKLGALPENLRHATSLQELYITSAGKLTEINDLPSLTEQLSIWGTPMLERVSNLPSLKHLQISDCPRLQHVENVDKLQYLELDLSEEFTTNNDGRTPHLPEWLLGLLGQHQNAQASLQNLRKFHLECSMPLLKTFLKDGPNWPIIEWIPEVTIESYGSNGYLYIRYTEAPPTFETNIGE